jgi:NADH pyrophosphatase NudC (nudix superfamily)
MAHAKKRTPAVEEVRPYVEGVAKNLVEKLYGPDGPPWGTTLTQIEDLLLDLRDVLTEKMLAESLARQASAVADCLPQARRCPSCQDPLAPDDTDDRVVHTCTGDAVWSEPAAYCTRCRRAFFPSIAEPRP